MPVRFVVYDVLGRPVAEEAIELGKGTIVIPCTELLSGQYFVQVYDGANELLTSMEITKQ